MKHYKVGATGEVFYHLADALAAARLVLIKEGNTQIFTEYIDETWMVFAPGGSITLVHEIEGRRN